LSKYKIFETDQFNSDVDELPKTVKNRILKKISEYAYPQLTESPHCGLNIKKLRNYDPDTWRYRVGDYRIFYEIDEDEMIVYITSIDQRKDVY